MKAIVEESSLLFCIFSKLLQCGCIAGKRISNEAIQASWNVAVGASARER